MIAQTQFPEDDAFELAPIASVTPETKGWSITRDDGWSFFVPPESPIEPKPGMTARFYGKGVGCVVRGLFIEGIKVFYRTEAEQEQYHLVTIYGADAAEWLKHWDAGQSVWSVEMGGLGPGYEQAIQITAAEVLRIIIAGQFDAARWSDTEAWMADREKIEEASFKNPNIEKLGLSAAQWGAALSVAARLYIHGPIKCLTDHKIKDRLILVSKRFPQG